MSELIPDAAKKCLECGRGIFAGERCNACGYRPGDIVCPALVAHHRGAPITVAACQTCKTQGTDECKARERLEGEASCQADRLTLAADEVERRGKVIAEKDEQVKALREALEINGPRPEPLITDYTGTGPGSLGGEVRTGEYTYCSACGASTRGTHKSFLQIGGHKSTCPWVRYNKAIAAADAADNGPMMGEIPDVPRKEQTFKSKFRASVAEAEKSEVYQLELAHLKEMEQVCVQLDAEREAREKAEALKASCAQHTRNIRTWMRPDFNSHCTDAMMIMAGERDDLKALVKESDCDLAAMRHVVEQQTEFLRTGCDIQPTMAGNQATVFIGMGLRVLESGAGKLAADVIAAAIAWAKWDRLEDPETRKLLEAVERMREGE